MRWQRKIFQMKEQDTRKLLYKMEISSLPDKEFSIMVIKFLTGLESRVDDFREDFNKENT